MIGLLRSTALMAVVPVLDVFRGSARAGLPDIRDMRDGILIAGALLPILWAARGHPGA